jgi:hypothetical protein
MNLYNVVLVFHILGAIGYFLGIGILLLILLDVRRTQRVEQARALLRLNDRTAPYSRVSAIVLLISGLYMAFSTWTPLPSWILVALVSLVVMVPISAVLIAPRRIAINQQLARETPEGALSADLQRRLNDPVLLATSTTVTTLLVGLVALMTTKPDLLICLIVMGSALLVGVVAGLLVSASKRLP